MDNDKIQQQIATIKHIVATYKTIDLSEISVKNEIMLTCYENHLDSSDNNFKDNVVRRYVTQISCDGDIILSLYGTQNKVKLSQLEKQPEFINLLYKSLTKNFDYDKWWIVRYKIRKWLDKTKKELEIQKVYQTFSRKERDRLIREWVDKTGTENGYYISDNVFGKDYVADAYGPMSAGRLTTFEQFFKLNYNRILGDLKIAL